MTPRVAIGVIGLFSAMARPAAAESWHCSPISTGETGPAVARRLTGNPDDLYQPWLRIVDPAGRFVPQSQYPNLRADWRVCLQRDLPVLSRPASPVNARRDGRTYDTEFAARVALAVFLMMLPWWLLDEYVRRTRPVPAPMRHHVQRFIQAFARPLLSRASSVPPISTRLRYLPARDEVEILIAPASGRRYPNLSDHKVNLEYDVQRVLRLLDGRLVVTRPLRVEGRWVVIPVRTAVDAKEAGVT